MKQCFLSPAAGVQWHLARDCPDSKVPPSESPLMIAGEFDGSDMPDANQAIMFTEYDLLLDSAASVSIVSNSHLQTEIRASRYLKINGIQRDSGAITISTRKLPPL